MPAPVAAAPHAAAYQPRGEGRLGPLHGVSGGGRGEGARRRVRRGGEEGGARQGGKGGGGKKGGKSKARGREEAGRSKGDGRTWGTKRGIMHCPVCSALFRASYSLSLPTQQLQCLRSPRKRGQWCYYGGTSEEGERATLSTTSYTGGRPIPADFRARLLKAREKAEKERATLSSSPTCRAHTYSCLMIFPDVSPGRANRERWGKHGEAGQTGRPDTISFSPFAAPTHVHASSLPRSCHQKG
eukprot:364405-Chlamydomonas_euryale.AAC.7